MGSSDQAAPALIAAVGSAPVGESVDGALQFPLSDEVMQKYMYGNAARLLNLG